MKKVQYNETDLVAFLKSGDVSQFEKVYDHFSIAIFGIINKIIGNNEQAQDVLQEVFLNIWNNSSSYKEEKSRLFTWMLTIARNSAADYIRSQENKEKQLQQTGSQINRVSNSTNVNDFFDTKLITKVIGPLKEEHKQIIDLMYFKGFTQDEISKKLNMSLPFVNTTSRTAIKILRNESDIIS
ncbi:MAG: sigma-70 family RNA polymerase sigma factor [Bacteroidota bacterium]